MTDDYMCYYHYESEDQQQCFDLCDENNIVPPLTMSSSAFVVLIWSTEAS
jgi:hypothetical protein